MWILISKIIYILFIPLETNIKGSTSTEKRAHSSESLHVSKLPDMAYRRVSPIPEGSRESTFAFKTPAASDRRSRIGTPLSITGSRR